MIVDKKRVGYRVISVRMLSRPISVPVICRSTNSCVSHDPATTTPPTPLSGNPPSHATQTSQPKQRDSQNRLAPPTHPAPSTALESTNVDNNNNTAAASFDRARTVKN